MLKLTKLEDLNYRYAKKIAEVVPKKWIIKKIKSIVHTGEWNKIPSCYLCKISKECKGCIYYRRYRYNGCTYLNSKIGVEYAAENSPSDSHQAVYEKYCMALLIKGGK
jgi:hypothetical protein